MPEVVYHYTSVETLLKLVDSSSIWATSIRYLNDIKELEHYVACIQKHAPNYLKNHDDQYAKVYNIDFIKLNEPDKRAFHHLPFVASFSLDADSLPQWRSYCPQGNGVSIGIYTVTASPMLRYLIKIARNPTSG